ncbi:bifunctional methylenetetrahydrofolate dehydrogenase/methenyltetrahydrofolate cyclohydrolase FolD [Bartonella sp. DGB2]|uniref:bifunctional methylenetetrahydrofolate dehydrogenase/methenyltetrahydrofolate cyclohydrolase FolD n=1 Tax=Bartonella sp. DGB2 TaxID=3388426 RepID=UPI00398FD09A
MVQLINGKQMAEEITAGIAQKAERLSTDLGIQPGIAVIIVGEDPASQVYVASKGKKAKACGFHSVTCTLPATCTEHALLAQIEHYNQDPRIHGILVQLPLPSGLDSNHVIQTIRPDKDVDGFHYINAGKLATGAFKDAFIPCTPAGAMIMIKRQIGTDLSGLNAVVVGRSNIVGKPIATLLTAANATVTLAHSRSKDLASICRNADILVAAVGRPELIKGNYIKKGAIVIDVGVNRIPAPEKGEGKTRLVGDVEFQTAQEVASAITPVPGGVGPMTIAMLMANTLNAALLQNGLSPYIV